MSELPKGWAAATLNDLLGAGALFSDGDWVESKDQDPNGANRLLQLADIGDGVFIDKSSRYVNDEKFSSLNCTELKEGDVLIARMPDPLGRACLMPAMPRRCLTVVDVAVFRVGDTGVSNKWLMYFLNSSPVRQEIELNSSGTTRKRISRGKLGEIVLPIPPLAEQTRIAAKLDELLAQVDTLKARIDGIPALLKRFRQSVLTAAVSGRLTEEWRASSPVSDSAEEYLARVIRNRRQKPVVKFKEPVSPDLEKREIEVPQGWIVASVSTFAECLDSMRVPVKKELRKSGEGKYPYFGANGEVDRVDEYIFDDDLVLVTEDETFYGREKPIAYKYSGKCWVNNHVHALRAHDSVARDYLCYALMHYDVIPWLTGTTGRAKLTQGALLSLPIQVPPPAEQTEIVRRVEQLFAFADQLEAKVNEARTRIDRLTQSILAKAFRGELVPQDPNDEPASVLLERIKAQRAAVPKARRGRRAATLG